jgi:hypothetical protein
VSEPAAAIDGTGPETERVAAWTCLRRIFHAWRDGRPLDMRPSLDEDMVMVLPGQGGRVTGADAVLEGYVAFCGAARIERMDVSARQLDVLGEGAVASYDYALAYARQGRRWLATGRDLWVLARRAGEWKAVWRTMLDLSERELD